VLGLTATADKYVRQKLCKLLNLKGHKEIIISPNRQNIRFTVANADKNLSCFDWLVSVLKSLKGDAPYTIIFCHTVSDIVLVLSSLMAKLGNDAYVDGTTQERCLLGVYYSATPESEKQRICTSFNGTGTVRVAIASTSLSMGVDFPHVTYVIHFGPGRSLVDHLQQAGRAGRDAKQSFNIIFYQGKHIRFCYQPIRDVIKKNDCIWKLLLCHFTEDNIDVPTMYDCCSRCHKLCACGGDAQLHFMSLIILWLISPQLIWLCNEW
jgi:ATP-dependent DNA helicase RecQ